MEIETILKLGVAAAILVVLAFARLLIFFVTRLVRWLRYAEWPDAGTVQERSTTALAGLRRRLADAPEKVGRATLTAARRFQTGATLIAEGTVEGAIRAGRAARAYVLEPLAVLLAITVVMIARLVSLSWSRGILPSLDGLGHQLSAYYTSPDDLS